MGGLRKAGAGRLLMLLGTVLVLAALLLMGRSLGVLPGDAERTYRTYEAVGRQMSSSSLLEEGASPFNQASLSVASVYGDSYVGTLEVPELELHLAVDAGFQDGLLSRSAATLWQWHPTTSHLVVAGDDSLAVFGRIGSLVDGSEVSFTNMEGVRFNYQVTSVETVDAQDEAALQEGDLVLVAPTFGGGRRVVVRCARA